LKAKNDNTGSPERIRRETQHPIIRSMDEKRGPLREREVPRHGSSKFQEFRLEHATAAFLCDAFL
jgi:hypothetical protein